MLDEQRGKDRGDDGHELDEDVEARAGRILERVADCVADYRRGVRRRAFAAVLSGFAVDGTLS